MELNRESDGRDKEVPNIPKPNILRFRCGTFHALTRQQEPASAKPPTLYAQAIKA